MVLIKIELFIDKGDFAIERKNSTFLIMSIMKWKAVAFAYLSRTSLLAFYLSLVLSLKH